MMPKILIVEDDKEIADYLLSHLEKHNFEVHTVGCARTAFEKATTQRYQVMILDRMLPGGVNGISLLRRLREAGIQTPVLILSALGQVNSRIEGFDAGADDYLPKPFKFEELLARVNVLVRNHNLHSAPDTLVLRHDTIEMDLLKRTCVIDGHDVYLLPKEFLLLEYFLRNSDVVITRKMLLENVWNYHFEPQTNVVEVHLSRLRAKVYRVTDRVKIKSKRKIGYLLETQPASLMAP